MTNTLTLIFSTEQKSELNNCDNKGAKENSVKEFYEDLRLEQQEQM